MAKAVSPGGSFFKRLACTAILLWLAGSLMVVSWMGRPEPVPPSNKAITLEKELNSAIERAEPELNILNLRARLIIEYLERGQEVPARKQISIYKVGLERNQALPLLDRVWLNDQMAIIHLALGEIEPAIKQYDANILAMAATTVYPELLAKARDHNNRAVGQFLWASTLEGEELRQAHFQQGALDLAEAKKILSQLEKNPSQREQISQQEQKWLAQELLSQGDLSWRIPDRLRATFQAGLIARTVKLEVLNELIEGKGLSLILEPSGLALMLKHNGRTVDSFSLARPACPIDIAAIEGANEKTFDEERIFTPTRTACP